MNDRITDRIRALLERAGHSQTPEGERLACLEKADAMMAKYRIDAAIINFDTVANGTRKPTHRDVEFNYLAYSDMSGFIRNIWNSVHLAFGVEWESIQSDDDIERVRIVGFEHQLDMAEMLYTQISIAFVNLLMPRWSSKKTFAENVYDIKTSGRSWRELIGMAPPEEKLVPGSSGRLIRIYKEEARRRGVEFSGRHSHEPERYRVSYATSFTRRIQDRLQAMLKKSNDEGGEKGAIALRSEEEQVKEYLWEMFPDRRPMSEEERVESNRNRQERLLQAWLEEEQSYNSLSSKERRAYDAKRRKAYQEDERWRRDYYRRYRADPVGWRAGAEAADSIDLGTDTRMADAEKGVLE